MKAGFIVRDRSLLSRVYEDEKTSYSAIAQRIDTDIVIEIRNIAIPSFITGDKFNIDKSGVLMPTNEKGPCFGGLLEMRVIVIKTGEIGGSMTFYSMPLNCERTLEWDNSSSRYIPRLSNNDQSEILRDLVSKMIKHLKE